MARGGYRPGAGRPKRDPVIPEAKLPEGVAEEAKQQYLTPLAYMLKVMNDPKVPADRRDKMAIAAAPYKHAKKADRPSKAGAADDAAGELEGDAGDWGADLFPGGEGGARPN